MKLIEWFMSHPNALMDIGNKVLIIVASFVIFVCTRKRERSRDLYQQSIELKDSTFQSLSIQYDDMSNRFSLLLKTHNKLEEEYYELKQNQERTILALKHHFEKSDTISRNELLNLAGDYLGLSEAS